MFKMMRNMIDDFMVSWAVDLYYIQEDLPRMEEKIKQIRISNANPVKVIRAMNPMRLTHRFEGLFNEIQPEMFSGGNWLKQLAGRLGFIKGNKEIGYEAEEVVPA